MAGQIEFQFEQLRETPCNLFRVSCPASMNHPVGDDFAQALAMKLFVENRECEFRAVLIDRLRVILAQGIDVEPSDSVIYADDPIKAMEYGEWPKVLMALRRVLLNQTFVEIPGGFTGRTS